MARPLCHFENKALTPTERDGPPAGEQFSARWKLCADVDLRENSHFWFLFLFFFFVRVWHYLLFAAAALERTRGAALE